MGLDEWHHSSSAYCDVPITDASILDDILPSLYQSAAKTLSPSDAAETAMKHYLSGKWRLTKVVYTADAIFMDALSNSESTALYSNRDLVNPDLNTIYVLLVEKVKGNCGEPATYAMFAKYLLFLRPNSFKSAGALKFNSTNFYIDPRRDTLCKRRKPAWTRPHP